MSVDLSGSTAFKNSQAGQEHNGSGTPKWVNVFQQFYSGFPASLNTIYQRHTTTMVGENPCPEIWKAVGDELVFCGKVSNKKAVLAALLSFIEAMHDYRKKLKGENLKLDLKGAAWLAAFPEPNRAVQLKIKDGAEEMLSASEALEAAADKSPFDYDFLGKAIDTGFRVASTATPERFALSVQLARLLVGMPAGSGFDHEIRFSQPILLKGVNGGEPYPGLYIDTLHHLAVQAIRRKERNLLKRNEHTRKEDLREYLDEYCSVVGTDEIVLLDHSEDTKNLTEPASYATHKTLIEKHFQQEKDRDSVSTSLPEPQDADDNVDLSTTGDMNPVDPLAK